MLLAITAFVGGAVDPVTGQEVPKPAEPSVMARNHAVLSTLPFANRDNFQDAARGFVAKLPNALVTGSKGNMVWSQKDYAFLEKEAPDTVNPSLGRQAQLSHQHGLFKVVDGLYRIRGFDISNMTVLEGDTGLIVIDPLLSIETAKAALDLCNGIGEQVSLRQAAYQYGPAGAAWNTYGVEGGAALVDNWFGGNSGQKISSEGGKGTGIPMDENSDYFPYIQSIRQRIPQGGCG